MNITKFQSDYKVISRSGIKNAPYNPRKISEKALNRIKKNIKELGLMGGIVVNSRTMNLVSGHQRLKALDQLEKTQDYNIRVEIVELTDQQEKEQNIFMNSTAVMGEYDYDLMKQIIPDIDYQLAGLDEYDLSIIGVDNLYETNEDTDQVKDINKLMMPVEERKQAVKDAKKFYKENLQSRQIDQYNSHVTIAFDSFANKSQFMQRFGFNTVDLFIKGEVFDKMIEIKND